MTYSVLEVFKSLVIIPASEQKEVLNKKANECVFLEPVAHLINQVE
jgi:hypothetical protein